LFEPPTLDGDDCPALPQKPLHISARGLWTCVISHPWAFTRDKIVAKAIVINGPNYFPAGDFRPPRLKYLNTCVLTDMK